MSWGRPRRRPAQHEPLWIGRKLHSDVSTEQCLEFLREGLAACGAPYADEPVFEAEWAGVSRVNPEVVFGIWCEPPTPDPSTRRVLYLAVWPSGGYQEVNYQEMALVPPERDADAAMPYIGHWKRRDPSLKSIGSVSSETFKVAP